MFITFEGLDFCGKTTQINLLKKYLEKNQKRVLVIREPGGTKISEKIRKILLDKKNSEMFFETELLLFSSSRAQLVREIIIPHLKKGYFVLSDRFHDSSIAYQGFGRGVSLDALMQIQEFAIGQAVPQLTFFIDIPLEEVERRKLKIGKENLDRIEKSTLEFYKKVRKGYRSLAKNEERFKVINGLETKSAVHNKIIRIISDFVLREDS